MNGTERETLLTDREREDEADGMDTNPDSKYPADHSGEETSFYTTDDVIATTTEAAPGNAWPPQYSSDKNDKAKLMAEGADPVETFDMAQQEHKFGPPFGSVGRTNEKGETVLSLSEAIERVGYGWQQIRVLVICGLCFCTDSIEVGLLTFLQVRAKEYFKLSDVEESTLTAVVFAGELIGALFWGPFADRCGRKRGSFFSASLVTAAGLARYCMHSCACIDRKIITIIMMIIIVIVIIRYSP